MKNYEENYGFRTIQEDMLNQRLTILQTGSKRSNIVGKTAASVAAVSLLTIIGNLLTDDPNIALQTAGTCIAMTSYAIGNAKLSNHYKKESDKIEEKLENLEEVTEIVAIREKLENYKAKLEYYKINYPTHLIAGIGFAESFVISLLNAVNAASTNGALSVIPLVLGSSLCGIVAVGHAKLCKNSKSQIKYYEEEIATIEEQKNPEQTIKLK